MSTALKQMSSDEFLLWAEGREGRWELHGGVPVMMAPERLAHIRTKATAFSALERGLERGVALRGPCGWRLRQGRRADDLRARRVRRVRPRRPDDTIVVGDPVVVEVLSPSTAAIDHGPKLSGYFSLPSVEHYLILDPERRVVIHHKRGRGEALETRVLSTGAAKLDPPGFEVAVEGLFPPASK